MPDPSQNENGSIGSGDVELRRLLDALPQPMWLSERGGNERSWFNRSWHAFTGSTPERAVGIGWQSAVHSADAGTLLKTYADAYAKCEAYTVQYRLRHRDGMWHRIEETGIPRFREGRCSGYVGSCADLEELHEQQEETREANADLETELVSEIEARKEAEANVAVGARQQQATERALIESERRFQILVQGVVDYAIFMLDPDGIVSNWNPGAERIKGYTADEIVGRHYRTFYTDEDRAAGVPERNLQTVTRLGKIEAEGWRLRKDGSRFWANAIIDAIRDEKGKLIGFAKVTRDMTERRQAQEELTKAREQLFQVQKMEAVGQLTGGVAHDFNNLLTIVIGSIEIAQRHLEKDGIAAIGQAKRLLGNALTGARRGATLTQRLLAFARRQPLDPKPLDVNRFISGLDDFLQRTLGERIDVQTVGGGGLWQVEVDSVQLESAILNLALNARDAMPGGGKLTVEASNIFLDDNYARVNPDIVPGQYVVIAVSDTGAGMTPEVVSRAFEPFFTTKTAGQGTGLGLSQVYGFVKQSGGHIKVYSEVDEGTTVKIYLPRLLGAAKSVDPDPQAVVGSAGGETILVVEDDPGVLEYVAEVLGDLNYRVLTATDGKSALENLAENAATIDLLLTDVVMPGINGRAVADRARQLKPDIKVLFMTGYSQNAIVHHGRLDAGVQLIQKPLLQAQLAARVRDVLDAPPRQS